jgi:release factor glutamine methyltransferase
MRSSAPTRGQALLALRRRFAGAGLDNAALDARLLLLAAVQIDPAELVRYPDEALTAGQSDRLESFARRRLAREPVARILGEREFWGLPFALSPETLVPRPDTETVVETVLRLRPERGLAARILDLGTGSGCLLVALLHEYPEATGLGVDRSAGALATARRNAWRNRVGERAAFVASDWAEALDGRFDIVVSNPPYIRSAVIDTLDADVREHDPKLALDGGSDGLDAYRTVLKQAERLLAPGGLLALEIGYDQEDDLRRLALLHPLEIVVLASDLSASPRCVALERSRPDPFEKGDRQRNAAEKSLVGPSRNR